MQLCNLYTCTINPSNHLQDFLVDNTIDFIQDAVEENVSFAVMLSIPDPHGRWHLRMFTLYIPILITILSPILKAGNLWTKIRLLSFVFLNHQQVRMTWDLPIIECSMIWYLMFPRYVSYFSYQDGIKNVSDYTLYWLNHTDTNFWIH